jgi:virulence factor
VDKPVTYNYESTVELINLATRKNLILMAGFNRRYAPAYVRLKELHDPNMIIMQKNRQSLPADVRAFVYDDFIHVLDTLLFLFPHAVDDVVVTGKKADGLLHHVVVHFQSHDGTTGIGIMNRNSGSLEERVEVFTPAEKWVVNNVTETIVFKSKDAGSPGINDWQTTLNKRGFEQIIDAFLRAIAMPSSPILRHQEILRTHEVCELVVAKLS